MPILNFAGAVRRLWRDERGFVVSSELVLITTIAVLGMVVGLSTIRDQFVLEFADTAEAVTQLNMSYSFAPVTTPNGTAAGSQYVDRADFCQAQRTDDDPPQVTSVNVNAPIGAGVAGGE